MGKEDPLEKQLTPVFLSGKFHGQRSLAGYSPADHKRVGHDLVTQRQQQQIVYLKAERVGFVKLAIGAQLPYNAVLASTVQ